MTTQTQKVYYPTTAISDGQHGEGFVAGGIRPIREDFTLFGKAITVKLPVGENGAVLEALHRQSAAMYSLSMREAM